MPRVNIYGVGKVGLNTDTAPHELPPEAWTVAQNIRFRHGHAERSEGTTAREGTTSVSPQFLMPMPSPTQPFWVYTDMAKVYAVRNSIHTDITRTSGGDYTGDEDNRWDAVYLNGIGVLNNGVDDPQLWSPITGATKLVVLPNWPASTQAKTLGVFGNFLIALNMTESGTAIPTKLRWSNAADPGTVPDSWDVSDPTNLAGSLPLTQTPGAILDGHSLGKSFMVYKSDAFIRLDRVTSNEVIVPRPISQQAGIAGKGAVAEFIRGQHLVFTQDNDIVVTDGQTVRSVADKFVKDFIEVNIWESTKHRTVVAVDATHQQAWVAMPSAGSGLMSEALVWEWTTNTWSERTLNAISDLRGGAYDTAGDDFFVGQLLSARPLSDAIEQKNEGIDNVGGNLTALLERTGLAVVGTDRDGQPKVDPSVVKIVTAVYPMVTADASISMTVLVGASDTAEGVVTWSDPQTFDPTTDEKVDCLIEGRFIAVRFFTVADDVHWAMHGYGLEINAVGEFF